MDLGEKDNLKWKRFIENIKSESSNSFVLEYNPHSPYMDNIKEVISISAFPNNEIKEKCIRKDHVWLLEYWTSSLSHLNLGDYDLDSFLKRFLDSIEIKKNGTIWFARRME